MESQFEAHLKTHITCPEGDCDFSASKRVVGAHFQTAHGQYSGKGLKEVDIEGQKFVVLVGDSPEDIAKWREERRKKWPSVVKKAAVTASGVQPKPSNTAAATISATTAYATRKRKLSSSSDELEEGEVSEDEEPVAGPDSTTTEQQQTVEAPIEPMAVPDASSSTGSEPLAKKHKKTALCKKFVRGQCRFGDHCNFSHDRSAFACHAMLTKGRCSKGSHCLFSHDPAMLAERETQRKVSAAQRAVDDKWRAESSSLLRKLLKKDIQTEQKQMLQVVRYIVQNGFFRDAESSQ
jgi:hypothetical protein